MVKQAKLTGGTMPSSTVVALAAGEGGQLAVEVGPIVGVVEVAPDDPSSVLAKRNQDDGAGVLGHKKSMAFFSLCALRQATGLTLGSIRSSSL